jgi:hypothetical protein
MDHAGATTYEEAEYQIGECSRYLWEIFPQQGKLLPFSRGGGTTWEISREQMRELADKYFLFRHFSGRSACDDPNSQYYTREGDIDIREHVQWAIDEGAWTQIMFHGIGGEWISYSEQAFVQLLDFLVQHEDALWVATVGDVWKYQQQYQAISDVSLSDADETGFSVAIDCDSSKLKTYGRPFTELYDQPLTVRVPVPDSWDGFVVTQGTGGDASAESYEVIEVGEQPVAQFGVRAGMGPVRATRGSP